MARLLQNRASRLGLAQGNGGRGNNSGGGGDTWGRGSRSSARPIARRGSRGERDDGGFNELSDFFEREDRSISNGDYPNAPLPGQPKLGVVTFTGKYINNPRHKKTLKGIVRNHWPTGPVDSLGRPRRAYFDIKWYSDVLTIFDTYYDYEEGMTEEDAHAKVKAHLSSNMRQLLFHERKKANEMVAASRRGTTRRDELEKVKDRPVTHVEFFEATHKSDFWTPEAHRMKDVLVKLWDEYRDSQSQGGGDESEAGTSSPPIIPLSPTKRRRLEADIAFKASKELAIGNAAVIAHAKDNLSYMPRSELDADIQHLDVDVIPHDHAHFAEYVRIASMAVTKILGTNGKTILEDDTHSDHGEGDGEGSGHGDIPDISEDEMMA
ncbi:hypothetical protein POM88_029017 [Heracleum sosnowskyi]|uniref:Uncharacterized protein n=1 Tax=Heracleum sosnowskyi TaxID=360622 RepID=A0AAD8HU64_9APIA|nr:hypothetical protein POM88_029017 [Heracleum sosnowskyi]